MTKTEAREKLALMMVLVDQLADDARILSIDIEQDDGCVPSGVLIYDDGEEIDRLAKYFGLEPEAQSVEGCPYNERYSLMIDGWEVKSYRNKEVKNEPVSDQSAA